MKTHQPISPVATPAVTRHRAKVTVLRAPSPPAKVKPVAPSQPQRPNRQRPGASKQKNNRFGSTVSITEHFRNDDVIQERLKDLQKELKKKNEEQKKQEERKKSELVAS
jgi:hypothetical protein